MLFRSAAPNPMTGLAAALQGAKLRKTGGPDSRGSPQDGKKGSAGSGYGTIGRSGGGAMPSMMDEMQKTLARRRAKVDRGSEEPDDGSSDRRGSESTPSPGKPGSESPKGRGRSSQDLDAASTNGTNGSNGTNGGVRGGEGDLEAMKQEILREMRKEIQTAKQEIIDVILAEMGRR